MPKVTYYAAASAGFDDAKAEIYGKRLQGIHELENGLPAAAVVEYARDKKDPLHPLFEWNDTKAGELYRRNQARLLIRSIELEIKGIRVRAFENVVLSVQQKDSDELKPVRLYLDQATVHKDPDLHEQTLRKALGALVHFRKRYSYMKELGPVIKAIEQLELEMELVPLVAG